MHKKIVSRFCFPNSHFTTLIEPYKNSLQTVLYWNHTLAYKIIPVKHLNSIPMYIELVHDTNVVNDEKDLSLSDFIYALKHFKHSDFGYKKTHLSPYMIIKTLYNFTCMYIKNYINYHFPKKDNVFFTL